MLRVQRKLILLIIIGLLSLCHSFNLVTALVSKSRSSVVTQKKDQGGSCRSRNFADANSITRRSLNSLTATSSLSDSSHKSIATVPVKLPIVGNVTLPLIFWKSMWMLVCIIWATNFPIIKNVYSTAQSGVPLDASMFIAIRFTIGSLLMLPGSWKRLKNPKLAKNGLLVGLSIFAAYVGQSIGIQMSTASKAAFICSMNVVWVTLGHAIGSRVFKLRSWIAVAMAVAGCAFMELKGHVVPQLGDLWLFLQPIGFGTGYLLLEKGMKQFPEDANAFTAFKLIGVAIASWVWAFLRGHTFADIIPIMSNPIAAKGILYTAFITTGFGIWMQSIVFKNVAATDASIILTTEPIWASIFAYFLLKETFTRNEYIGGALIVLGCLYNEIDVGARAVNLFRKVFPGRKSIPSELKPFTA